jgi:hypothetical protein
MLAGSLPHFPTKPSQPDWAAEYQGCLMFFYMLLAAFIFTSAICQIYMPKMSRTIGIVSVLALILFAGLRFQTGNDWLWYKTYFDSVQPIWHSWSNLTQTTRACLSFEVFYLWLNILLKSLSDNYAVLLFVVAAFSIATMHVVLRNLTRNEMTVWAFYLGTCFMATQMATLRASIAASLTLAGLALATKRRFWLSTLLAGIAIGFQVFSSIFLPIIWLKRWLPRYEIIVPVIGVGFALVLFDIDVSKLAMRFAAEGVPDAIAFKLRFYAASPSAHVSIPTFGMIIFHCAVLGSIYFLTTRQEKNDPVIKVGAWLCLYVIGFHLFFFGTQALWNRTMIVTIPWEIATFFRIRFIRKAPNHIQVAIIVVLCSVSLASLYYFLSNPLFSSYRPYQSWIHVWFNQSHDGLERYYSSLPQRTEKQEMLEVTREKVHPLDENQSTEGRAEIGEATATPSSKGLTSPIPILSSCVH